MVGCYFHAHRPQDGQWLPADAMPKSDTGQPVAYVAKGAHGLYTSVSAWSVVQVPACHLLSDALSCWSASLTAEVLWTSLQAVQQGQACNVTGP